MKKSYIPVEMEIIRYNNVIVSSDESDPIDTPFMPTGIKPVEEVS